MLNFMRKNRGSISIFLCLILLPMVTYSAMIVDASRMQSCRTQLQGAGDLTMNAALSEYEQILEDMYGLFAVSENSDELKKSLENYFYETISGQLNSTQGDTEYTKKLAQELTEVIFKDGMTDSDITNFLSMKLDDFQYEPIPESRISNPLIMESQIIDYMKYKGPVSFANNIMTKIGLLKDSSNQVEAANKKIEYTQKVTELGDPMQEAYNAIKEYNEEAKKYAERNYNDKKTIHNMVDKMCRKIWNVANNIILRNNYTWYYKNKMGTDSKYGSTYDSLPSDGISFWLNGLNADNINNLGDAKLRLNAIRQLLCEQIVDIDNGNYTYFEQKYGTITIDYGDGWAINNVSFANAEEKDGCIASYSNLQKWIQRMINAAGYSTEYFYNMYDGQIYSFLNKSDSELMISYYDEQKYFLDNIEDLSEYKKYHELFLKLNEMYCSIYLEYDDEMEAEIENEKNESEGEEGEGEESESEEPSELEKQYYDYTQLYNLFITMNIAWEDSPTYKSYRDFLNNYVGNDSEYKNSLEKEATKDFKEYYNLIVSLEAKSKTVSDKLERILSKLEDIEKKEGEWNTAIDKVNDATTKSQMQSDLNTLADSVKREDIENLKKIVDDTHAQLEALKQNIESVSFMKVQLCKNDFDYDSQVNNECLKAPELQNEKAIDIINDLNKRSLQDNLWNVGDLIKEYVYEPIDDTYDKVSDNVKYLELFDGKNSDNTERPEETFYNVLYNMYGNEDNKPEKPAQGSAQSNVIENINNTTTPSADAGTPAESGGNNDGNSGGNAGDDGAGKAGVVNDAFSDIKSKNNAVTEIPGFGSVSNSDVPTSDNEDDYKNNADSGKESLGAAKELLTQIGKIAETARNDIYLEEYFTEMFSCQTDKKLDAVKFINGYGTDGKSKPINTANEWYGKEIEYILWGNADLDRNIATNEGYIFLVRFALNAIYAFTATDIQQFANMTATALVGWSVVLVPVVQVCITLGIALAESAYDLNLLRDGKDVAVIKDKNTFVCSPTGALKELGNAMIEKAEEKVTGFVNDKVDEFIDNIDDKANKKISECEDEINNTLERYSQTLADSIETAIQDQFITPLINTITPIVNRLDSTKSNLKSLVDEKIDEAWKSIGDNINNMEGGIIKDLTLEFYNDKGNELKDSLKSGIIDKINSFAGKISVEEIQNTISKKINTKIDNFRDKINDKVKETTGKMKDAIMAKKNEAATNLKSYMHEQIDVVSSNISGTAQDKLDSYINDYNEYIKDNKVTTTDKSASGGLTLNYKEYCKIFMFIKLLSNSGKTDCLLRAAALIEANVKYASENANPDFQMASSYTLVYVGATVEMSTLFPWGISVQSDDTGTAGTTQLDFENLGNNSVKINYSGINGY